ncbi:MAG: cell wall-binding repeat-containing protein [Coriobacteriia bacterium]
MVRGDHFADALVVASIAAQEKIPVLLTTTAALNAEAGAFLTGMGTDDVYIAGGVGAVSDALAGGAVMGHRRGLLLLTKPTVLSPATGSLIGANKATIDSIEYFGGTGALAPAIATSVQPLLQ